MLLKVLLVAALAVALAFSVNSRPRNLSLPRSEEDFLQLYPESRDLYIPPPGKFVKLSHGWTHYTSDLPAGKNSDQPDVVVLVHGLHDSVTHWNAMKRVLVDEGFHVITYDNYGNGWSDAPDAIYNEALYVSQLAELLLALNVTRPVHLLGQSLGGAISSAFASTHPTRVKSLTTMCPAGLSVNTPLIARIANLPVISDLLNYFVTPSILLGRIEAGFNHSKYTEVKQYVLKMMKYQLAFNRDLLRVLPRVLTQFPLENMHPVYSVVGNLTFPVHIVWGEKDLTAPSSNARVLKAFVPRAEMTLLPDLGHSTHLQDPDTVNAAVLSKLKKFSSA